MIRYFVVEEVTEEKFNKIQGELNTDVSIGEEDRGVISAWGHGRNIDGYTVAMVVVDDYETSDLPALDLEDFEQPKIEQEED